MELVLELKLVHPELWKFCTCQLASPFSALKTHMVSSYFSYVVFCRGILAQSQEKPGQLLNLINHSLIYQFTDIGSIR